MSERLFLLELKMELRGLPEDEINEIMEDYQTYFQEAKKEGFTDDEIIDRLGGSAQVLATSIMEKREVDRGKRTQSNVSSILMIIGLIFFNVIIVLGPFVALVGAGISLLVAFGVCLISPLLVLLNIFVQGAHLFEFMVSLVLFGVALLIYPWVIQGIHFVVDMTKKYIAWNKRVMQEGRL
ncbi:MAG TPA: DUF1700 domain-containing protein [Bacillota bacterium]|nr:DUF1700 domain-containing protein [Bacillota bacterium]